MNRSIHVAVSFLLTGAALAWGAGATPAASGPHGGQVVSDGKSKVEVKVDTPKGGIDAYVLRNPGEPPSSLQITFYDKEGEASKTIELQAMRSQDPDGQRFHGVLSTWSGSYLGFEVKIPLGKGGEKVLRSGDSVK